MSETRIHKRKQSWRLGRYALFTWSVPVFVLIVLAFAAVKLWPNLGLPRDGSSGLYDGGYPLFWLVYVCVPLFLRDLFVLHENGERLGTEHFVAVVVLFLSALLAYRFVFGWF